MIPMPAAVVLIVCKVAIAGPPDQNSGYTGHQNLEWATEHSQMICRRQEVQLYDPAVGGGYDRNGHYLSAAPQPFNQQRCWRSGLQLGAGFDAANGNKPWRFWRVACPVKIVNTITGEIIGWQMPDCGRRDVVKCEGDTSI